MSGFITESVSKISDGFGSTVKMLLFMILTTFAIIPIRSWFGTTGVIVFLVLLLCLAIYYLLRPFQRQLEETKEAWCGMATGVLLWQATRTLAEIPGMNWFDKAGLFYWIALLFVTIILWKKFLPTSIKFTLLTFLLNWLGSFYLQLIQSNKMLPVSVINVIASIHYLGILGMLISIWWIVTRSQTGLERRYAGLVLYFSVLLTFLLF